MITVVFRYDDCRDERFAEAEREMVRIGRKYGTGFVFGIIPFSSESPGRAGRDECSAVKPLPPGKAEELKYWIENRWVDPAQHGYSHKHRGHGFNSLPCECIGSFDDQKRRFGKGKRFLESALGCRIMSFIPPWNTFDAVTLAVLEDLDFKIISARFDSAVPKGNLIALPMTCRIHALPDPCLAGCGPGSAGRLRPNPHCDCLPDARV